MRRTIVPMLGLVIAAFATASSAEEVKSGLQVGERTSPYNVKDITGPNKGRSLCYR